MQSARLGQKQIYEMIRDGKVLTRQQVMRNLGSLKLNSRTIQIDLAKLKMLGLIDSQPQGRSTIWHII